MSLPEFPQIDLRKRRRRPRAAVPQTEDVRPVPPARARGPRGGWAVCQVASRTKPDIWYTVYIVEGGTLFFYSASVENWFDRVLSPLPASR
jgi:hypothetical protein